MSWMKEILIYDIVSFFNDVYKSMYFFLKNSIYFRFMYCFFGIFPFFFTGANLPGMSSRGHPDITRVLA